MSYFTLYFLITHDINKNYGCIINKLYPLMGDLLMNKCVYASILVLFVIGCKETQVRQSDFAPFKKPVTLSTTTEAVEKNPGSMKSHLKKGC